MSGIVGSKLNIRGSGRIAKLGTDGQVLTSSGAGVQANYEDAAGGGLDWQSVVTASTFTAVAGNGYPVNTTSNACTVTLPASASVGDEITFTDYARNFATNALTINPNSLNYQGASSPNPVYDTAGESIHIVYMDATKGWIPTYDGAVAYETPQTYNIEHLVVAGGGGGGLGHYGGGGGAGGYLTATATYTKGVSSVLTVVVGPGATGSSSASAQGGTGTNSSITSSGAEATVTSDGGGGGGSRNSSTSGGASDGADGGSGGGGSFQGSTGGSATAGQGYDGGDTSSVQYGAGGGGAGEIGPDGTGSPHGADGGDGLQNNILVDATDVYYAGGGAGGGGTTRTGGQGGGGSNTGGAGGVGTDGLGGGGSGAGDTNNGGDGGDGVVILRMLTADYSGTSTNTEAITTDGSYTILKWLVDGTYTID